MKQLALTPQDVQPWHMQFSLPIDLTTSMDNLLEALTAVIYFDVYLDSLTHTNNAVATYTCHLWFSTENADGGLVWSLEDWALGLQHSVVQPFVQAP